MVAPRQLTQRLEAVARGEAELTAAEYDQEAIAALEVERILAELEADLSAVVNLEAAERLALLSADATAHLSDPSQFKLWLSQTFAANWQVGSAWQLEKVRRSQYQINTGQRCLILSHESGQWQMIAFSGCSFS